MTTTGGGGLTGDEQAVWDAMRVVYTGYLAGDSAAVDAVLHPQATFWDSAEPGLVSGLTELAALRARRLPTVAGAATVIALEATDPVVDVWGDVALLRHVLRVGTDDGGMQVVRNTSVWRRTGGRWLAVHNHEDVLAG